MKRTKIICTLGPATDNEKVLGALMDHGMDVARFNFSHGTHEEQKTRLELLKKVREEKNIPVAALLDTKGPEIRTGLLKDGVKSVTLVAGEEYTLTTREIEGDEKTGFINYAGLPADVKVSDRILIDDGLIELSVKEKTDTDIVCQVVNGGVLGTRKGVNVPGVKVRLPGITEQDKKDILFGIENDFDYIAASFVRSAECILEIKEILMAHGSKIKVIAKIENREGIDNFEEIMRVSDGIMVARGDMGVEISPEQLPYLQKTMIRMCNDAFKPVITATQMLDSMIRNPRPTRAEVTDVANAIYDGTDVVMLSGETAMGKYPVEAVSMMSQIAETTEFHLNHKELLLSKADHQSGSVSSAVAYASVTTAQSLGVKAIITPTISGHTPRIVSAFRPAAAIIATSPDARVLRQMQLIWGVKAIYAPYRNGSDEVVESSMELAKLRGLVDAGDLVVLTAGMTGSRSRESGITNAMRVLTVG
ncbi:MAG: pyruvate kinase [Lachnospiraceae bacterium]|jgi:pyruvate kinase|nr:pyruvate kinase [Lachnospiraceae bacterium]